MAKRSFLFLQGPHGPFFDRLGQQLRAAGAGVWRVGFNRGDRAFWSDAGSYIPFTAPQADWPETFRKLIGERSVSDLVLYGDTRPVHAEAVRIARQYGLRIHVFEEGYLRPYWVTYERGGSNGHSRLIETPISRMRAMLGDTTAQAPDPDPRWGDLRAHVFYGALYHWYVMLLNGGYPHFRPHRSLNVRQEFQLYLQRLLLLPLHATERILATRRIDRGGFPYHLVLLQLEHDSSFQHHGPFRTMTDFLECCLKGFAEGAPPHHHLVFKAHPLDDGRAPIRSDLRRLAKAYGLSNRVHFVRGGKLAQLLGPARSAITVNSTAGQQVLWRGIPLRTFGAAVYAKPELVSSQPLPAFFAKPDAPDRKAYATFRRYLLDTSQVPGSFYSRAGRTQLLRRAADMMLCTRDPYDTLNAASGQQIVDLSTRKRNMQTGFH
ncbi:capsular polysaccharide export protein [Rhodovulum imhoffii]|uniref:Capsular polysaccharide export protein n=1 Tax=Rhodovulum imhoffii TaxID=365340 RepID=A0A2T5BVT9_9RHOB|nr:capsular biosynthesis protein [Rhodovulum imhoffii]MBK5933200.1 capsule biosynthesis protein CapA [Rhodovulum imhoffii]PTN03699.1 capsular polysaccharide export protein [Rhodovulum imhoffii]